MYTITKVGCSYDGSEHDTQEKAEKHLANLYGNILTKLAHQSVSLNYKQLTEFFDDNLYQFVELNEIRKDLEFISESID